MSVITSLLFLTRVCNSLMVSLILVRENLNLGTAWNFLAGFLPLQRLLFTRAVRGLDPDSPGSTYADTVENPSSEAKESGKP